MLDYLPWHRPREYDDRPCVADDRTALTYRDFAQRAEAVAEQLAELGVGRGDVVAVMLPNRVELLLVLVAAWRLGAAATPVNPAFTGHEASYQVSDAGAKVVVSEGSLTTLHVDELRTTPAGTLAPASTGLDDIALIIYTSGSTGRPKGVLLSHRNLEAMTTSMAQAVEIGESDHCLLFLPLFHANALFVSFLTPIRTGARLTVLSRFRPDELVAAVERHRPTYFSGVPTIFAMLVAHQTSEPAAADLSSLRFAICGAAPASRELLAAARERLGLTLVEGYGLTEGTCASTVNRLGQQTPGSVGVALPGQEVAIMRADGELAGPGERGEVVVRGDNVMVGYLGRPEATAEALRDGWLHTGDVGVLDEDGFLFIVDRIKDMIIRGGENLHPKEIESVLTAHAGVLEAAVVGAPDAMFGEVPVAYVTTYPDADVQVEDLLALCRERLTRVKVPVAVSIVEALPRNPVGKIDKPALRASLSTIGA